ncbi:MAG: hypothetical protein AB7F96_15410 [Beijerinckiaceae bacterium]
MTRFVAMRTGPALKQLGTFSKKPKRKTKAERARKIFDDARYFHHDQDALNFLHQFQLPPDLLAGLGYVLKVEVLGKGAKRYRQLTGLLRMVKTMEIKGTLSIQIDGRIGEISTFGSGAWSAVLLTDEADRCLSDPFEALRAYSAGEKVWLAKNEIQAQQITDWLRQQKTAAGG